MKIGITSGSLRKYDENNYKKMAEVGFLYADFDLADTETEWYMADEAQLAAMVANEKQKMTDAGITLNQIHGPWRWPPQDNTEEDRAERMEKMKKSIHIANLFGCRNWVIHPIMPNGTNDLDLGDDIIQNTWELNITFMRELLAYAKEQDVIICFENMPMPRFSIGSVADIMRVVREMNDDHFKVCLDTGHVNVFPGQTLYDAVKLIGSNLRVMHVHDNDGHGDQHKLPYFGTADWEGFGRALKEIGYTGVFSFETSPSWDMPDEVFDDTCRLMVKMAENLRSL